MHKYNTHFPSDATAESLTADRTKILNELFGKVGEDTFMEPPLYVDYGCNISVGEAFYSNFKYVTRHLSPVLLPVDLDLKTLIRLTCLQHCSPRLQPDNNR